MRMLSTVRIFSFLSIFVLGSCKTTGKGKSELEGEVSGLAQQPVKDLGYGFNSKKESIRNKCFEGTRKKVGGQVGEIRYTQDLDLNTMQNVISGGANLGVALSIFNVKGGGDVAVKEAVDEFSSSISLVYEVQAKREMIDDIQFIGDFDVFDSNGNPSEAKVISECGDEVFDQFVYGATFVVNAKFQFATRQDKVDFKGNASVSLAGIGEIGGHINGLNDKLKRNSKVTIFARQVGGNVAEVGTVLDDSVITCSLADFDKTCLPMLKKVVNYVVNIHKQLQADPSQLDASNWAQLRAVSTPIMGKSFKIKGKDKRIKLLADTDMTLQELEVEDARIALFLQTQELLKTKERVASMNRNDLVPADQKSKLETMYNELDQRYRSVAVRNTACLKTPTLCKQFKAENDTFMKEFWAKHPSLDSFGETCFTENDLKGTKWRFKRWKATNEKSKDEVGNNTTVTKKLIGTEENIGEVELLSDMKIGGPWGGKSAFEKTWSVKDCQLRFQGGFGPQDKPIVLPSTLFDSIESRNRMTGVFLYDLNFRHVLERI